MTRGRLSVMMLTMATGTHLFAGVYGVVLEPDTAKRKVIAIDCGAETAYLCLAPHEPWHIGGSRINDDLLATVTFTGVCQESDITGSMGTLAHER